MDPDALTRRIARRQAHAQRLETEMILGCEAAARRCGRESGLPANRADWTPAAWRRYLTEAMRLNQQLGPRLNALRREIDALERLASDLLAV